MEKSAKSSEYLENKLGERSAVSRAVAKLPVAA